MKAKVLPLTIIFCLIFLFPGVNAAQYMLTGFQEFNVFDVQKDMFDNVYNVSFDKSTEGKAITLIHFKVPQDHQVDYTIYYGTGNTFTGSAYSYWNNSFLPLHTTTSTITFNGITKTYSYLDTNPEYDYYLTGYAKDTDDNTTGMIVYNAGYGSFDNDLAVYVAVPNIAANLIYKVDLSSDIAFDADISYGTYEEVAGSVTKNQLDVLWDWINFGISTTQTVFEWAVGLFYWLVFIWDNIIMIISLYIAACLAFAARNARGNMQKFYRQFFNDQKKLFEFLIGMWHMFTSIIANMRSLFHI